MQIAVYGANGYLGSSLVLRCAGVPLLRDEFPTDAHDVVVIDASFPSRSHSGSDWAQYRNRIVQRLGQVRESGSTYVYLGSMSSLCLRPSSYGRKKREIEDVVLSQSASVMRLGLVTDQKPGGRHRELVGSLKRLPFVAVPTRDDFPLYVTPLRDFLRQFLEPSASSFPRASEWVCPGTQLKSLREVILEEQNGQLGGKRFVNLPRVLSRSLRSLSLGLTVGPLDSLSSLARMRQFGWRQVD